MQLSRQASEQVNNVDVDININVEKQKQQEQQQSENKESNAEDEQRSDTPKSAETAASRTSSPTTSGPDSQISDNVNQGFDRLETGQLNLEEKQPQQPELGNVDNDTNVDQSNVTNIEVEPQHTTESVEPVESVEPSQPNQSVQPEDGQSDQRKEPNQSVAEVQLSDGGSESVKAGVTEPVVEVGGKRVEFGDAVDDKSVCKDDASESKVWVFLLCSHKFLIFFLYHKKIEHIQNPPPP